MMAKDDDTGDLFSYYAKSGDELRDEGLARVSENSGPWMSRAVAAATRVLPRDWTGTGEDIRIIVTREIGKPHSPNAWGALINALAKPGGGILIDTGKVRKMKAPKSHSRRTPVYRRA
jgi:hypothetical protein